MTDREDFIPFDEFHDMVVQSIEIQKSEKKEYVMDNFIALYISSIQHSNGLYLISRNKVGFRAGIKHGIKFGFLNQKVLSDSFHSGDVTVSHKKRPE